MSKLVNVEDYHQAAKIKLPKYIYDYYASGSDDQVTLNKTLKDFNKIKLLPRVLIDVSKQDMTTELFGEKVRSPILIAPTAMHKMATAEGEVATAKAAASLNTIYTMSSLSTTKITDVAAASSAPKWFQLYVLKDRKLSEAIVRQVEQAGFKALVLTVDTPILGRRLNDIRNNFKLPYGLELEVFKGLPMTNLPTGLLGFVAEMLDKSLDWTSIEWLKSITKLPVIVKGVLSPEDAVLAVKHGADGIIVSNHGARQLDTVPSTIEVLPFIVQAVSGKVPVIFDGGVRRGTDVLKAIAFGAKAVMLGRPVLWGLAEGGESGVKDVYSLIEEEFRTAMALAGCGKISDITRELIYDRRKYSRL